MADQYRVDARGLSCPQPALMTRQALQVAELGAVCVLVDTMTQVQNCTRAAERLGWQVSVEEKEGAFELAFRK
jgi:tRNA 2-thiouridine synthesizing protein A